MTDICITTHKTITTHGFFITSDAKTIMAHILRCARCRNFIIKITFQGYTTMLLGYMTTLVAAIIPSTPYPTHTATDPYNATRLPKRWIGQLRNQIRVHLDYWGWTYLIIFCTGLLTLLPILANPMHRLLTQADGSISNDTYNYLYTLLRFAMNAGSHVNPFIDPTQNYPEGLDLISTDMPWLMYWAIPPSIVLISPTLAFNLLILCAHILTGVATAYWAKMLGVRNQWALRIAAIAAILLPFRAMHAIEHPNIVATQFVVLWFLALEWWIQATTHHRRHYYGMAAVAFLLVANSFQYTFISMILSIVYVGVRLNIHRLTDLEKYYRLLFYVGSGCAIGALPLLRAQHINFHQFTADETGKFSALLISYLIPSPITLWQKLHILPVNWYASSEQVLYIGIVTTLLALIGMRIIPIKSRWSMIGTMALGILLSFGARIEAPHQFVDQWPLPAQILQTIGLGAFRAWARFGGVVALFVCAFAAFGVEYVLERTQQHRIRYLIVGALIIGIGVDTFPLYQSTPVPTNSELTNQLATLPANAVVMFVPNVASRSIADTLYETRFQLLRQFTIQHMVSYGHSAHWPMSYSQFERDMRRIDDPITSVVLCRKGVTHLVINNRLWQNTPAFTQNHTMHTVAITAYWRIIALVDCK